MAELDRKPRDPARKAASRVMLAGGLLLALLVLLGITGLASVTLFYIEFDSGTAQDSFERTVIATVKFFDGWFADGTRWHLVRHIHGIGAFLAIVLTGWAAVEIWGAAAVFRQHLREEVRATARWMRPLAALGTLFLLGAIVVQLLAGAATRGALDDMRVPAALDRPPSVGESDRIVDSLSRLKKDDFTQTKDEVVVQVHMRELNYPLGFGALLLLMAVMAARRAAIILDSEPKAGLDVTKDKPKQV